MALLAGLQGMSARKDIIAGITVAAIAIPEGLGYAKIVGLPVETGLYCALLPPLLFALMGSSRQLVVGADSATAALVAAGAGAVAAAGTAAYVDAVAVLGMMTAFFLVLVVLARLDFLADLISRPVLAGFLSGVGVSLMIGKLPGMLGIEASGTTWDKLVDTVTGLGEISWPSALLGVGTVVVMLGLEMRLPKVPAALAGLASMAILGVLIGAEGRGVAMVGTIPAGLPMPSWPGLEPGEFARMAATAASIAIVILAQSAAVSGSFALKRSYPVSIRQDMLGLAVANAGSAVTQGFAINGSPPRTAAGDSAGGRSQLINISQAVTVGLVLVFLTGLFDYIPSPVLDGVVFAIGVRLVKVQTLREVGRASRVELGVALLALLVVAFVGVEQGILLAVVVALIDRLRRQYHPNDEVLIMDGRIEPRLQSRVRIPAEQLRGILLYRFNSTLFFANAPYFAERVRGLLAQAAEPVRHLVIDAAAMAELDFTGAETLHDLATDMRAAGGVLVVTEVSPAARRMIERTGIESDLVVVDRIEDLGVFMETTITAGPEASPDPG